MVHSRVPGTNAITFGLIFPWRTIPCPFARAGFLITRAILILTRVRRNWQSFLFVAAPRRAKFIHTLLWLMVASFRGGTLACSIIPTGWVTRELCAGRIFLFLSFSGDFVIGLMKWFGPRSPNYRKLDSAIRV